MVYPTDRQEWVSGWVFFPAGLTFLKTPFRMSAGCQRKNYNQATGHSSQNVADLGSATLSSGCTDGNNKIMVGSPLLSGKVNIYSTERGRTGKYLTWLTRHQNALSQPLPATVPACTRS